jgi:hypothetical protein
MASKEDRLQEQKRRGRKAGPGSLLQKNKKDNFIILLDDKFISDPNNFGMNDIVIMNPEKKAKGGRAGFKSGSKGCKLAMKGKGRAYGKNS